ncbi:MAG: terminase small subunit [Oscillospiraceae bacterium]|nr:terminase small subunit [Oscillospiraceae bacterium]
MGEIGTIAQEREFCRVFLQTMDAARAGAACGADGFSLLRRKTVRERLRRLRTGMEGMVTREDVLRRLCALAFGQANDAVRLAMGAAAEEEVGSLDLSLLAEFKRGANGGVEVRLADRVKALEVLYNILSRESENGANAVDFLRALEETGEAD